VVTLARARGGSKSFSAFCPGLFGCRPLGLAEFAIAVTVELLQELSAALWITCPLSARALALTLVPPVLHGCFGGLFLVRVQLAVAVGVELLQGSLASFSPLTVAFPRGGKGWLTDGQAAGTSHENEGHEGNAGSAAHDWGLRVGVAFLRGWIVGLFIQRRTALRVSNSAQARLRPTSGEPWASL